MTVNSQIHMLALHHGWRQKCAGNYVRGTRNLIVTHAGARSTIARARLIDMTTGEQIAELGSRDRDKAEQIIGWIVA